MTNARPPPFGSGVWGKVTTVCFLPFWEPHLTYASSRLRALFPVAHLSKFSSVRVQSGRVENEDIYFVVQLCSDSTLDKLNSVSHRAIVAYVVCDNHYDDDSSIAGVNPKYRFADLCAIADIFIVPTETLKGALQSKVSGHPVFVIPDTQDYWTISNPEPVPVSEKGAWFGNPGKGNFDSVKPYLDYLIQRGFDLLIISRRAFFDSLEAYSPYVVDWCYDSFVSTLRTASFSVITVDPAQTHKSENRLVSSVMNGVPALVSGHAPGAISLNNNGMDFAVFDNMEEFSFAITKIQMKEIRVDYLERMQKYFEREVGERAIAIQYLKVIDEVFALREAPLETKGET